ncbi:MAG TPA: hypothetical protein VK476_04110 [Flavobacterium sp.]|nr:hypothetical protein [Flavobacterium sp.]
MKNYDLHERLIDFAVMIINIAKDVENSKAGNHLVGQLIRSGSSPSLNSVKLKGQNPEMILYIKCQLY